MTGFVCCHVNYMYVTDNAGVHQEHRLSQICEKKWYGKIDKHLVQNGSEEFPWTELYRRYFVILTA